jgi:hypothetical protein
MIVLTWVLGPEALKDSGEPIQLATRSLATNPERIPPAVGYGAALFRAGRSQAAIHALENAIAASGDRPIPLHWLFLAMAHDQLGRKEDARRWLDKARVWINQKLDSRSSSVVALGFVTRDLPVVGAGALGFMASPYGQGPVIAATTLALGRRYSWDRRIAATLPLHEAEGRINGRPGP